VTTAPASESRPNTSVGTRIACHSSASATRFCDVKPAIVASRPNAAVPDTTPVAQASARDALTPERAAKIIVNPANASGARERVKDAAAGSIPVAATYSAGSVTSSGTRLPNCHAVTPAGQSADQSAPAPKVKTKSSVSGARVAAMPTATAMAASTAERRATVRRCMRHRPYPAPGPGPGRRSGRSQHPAWSFPPVGER
jgi:hypothetical protein